MTVYNRKEVTLQGLRSLYNAIEVLGGDNSFDIYMTNDGCTDGTCEAVHKEFSDIHIIQGDGSLYWSGGMRKAWQTAIECNIEYDCFLWFNDDADLYDDALASIFKVYDNIGPDCIVTGAFCDHNGKASYGGKLEEDHVMEPNGQFQRVVLMNGNLVLIPYTVYSRLGTIDRIFKHGLGDHDYGLRAQKKNIGVFLTDKYVGVCDRHDTDKPSYLSSEFGIIKRFNLLYSPINNPYIHSCYIKRYKGFYRALRFFLGRNIYTLFPFLYRK